ncbi:MAG: histidine phosphatase family protein [Planctomycetota bacterium]
MLKSPPVPRILLMRPGSTDMDQQGRIKGSLDMPLSDFGRQQVDQMAQQVRQWVPRTIYSAPCESAIQTADHLSQRWIDLGHEVKIKIVEDFRNLDHGLWHGKLIDELRRNHPKQYRRGAENPDAIQPPGGESVDQARQRVVRSLKKIVRRGGDLVAIVMPDPMGQIMRQWLTGQNELGNLWEYEHDDGHWDLIPSHQIRLPR